MTVAPRAGRDALSVFRERFGAPPALVGMLHLGALPGTPSACHSIETLIQHAVSEARIYRDAGFTAVAIENMHDRPYLKGGVGPEITAAITALAREVKRDTGLVLGIQVLAAANREALAIAHASAADFVRVEGFVYAHVADEGIIESCAGELLRYRRAIGADEVLIFADIKKKHSAHAITADVSIVETAFGFGTAEFPAFYRRSTGLPVDHRYDSITMLAAAVRLHLSLGLGTAVLIANPIPTADEMSSQLYEHALHTALSEADARRVQGRALTPFLLDRMRALTGGDSVRANVALLRHNAQVAAALAVADV